MTNCKNTNTRAEFFLSSQSLYQENVPIFREIVILRDEAAKSFASQKLRQQLVNSPDKVSSLLDKLTIALQLLAKQELQVLQQGVESPLRLSDFDFYHNQMLREKYHVDHELVAEYFPAEVTVRRMLDIFKTPFALAIKELNDLAGNRKWHPDVAVYSVWEQMNQGILTVRQVAFSKFDMKIRNPAFNNEIEATDCSELYNSLLQNVTGLQGPEDRLRRGSGYATTSHYVWGQEANYYPYL